MKFKIIDKCCNIDTEIEPEINFVDGSSIIALAKEGHQIIIHTDRTIEYLPNEVQEVPKRD
jgi:hypothetical protein